MSDEGSQVPWSRITVQLRLDDVDVRIAALHAPGPEPVVLLHGFGSTKEEYADLTRFPGLEARPFLAYDAPGFGASTTAAPDAVSVPFLLDVALAMLDRLHIDTCHVVGHSMGGLTALLLAAKAPGRVLTFTDIEGNLAPEDCFLSRQIVTHTSEDPHEFLRAFADRSARSGELSGALYGARVLTTVDPHVVRPVFESMVGLSDRGDLLDTFTGLPMPRMFVHGQQNAHLSYLPELRRHAVEVFSVPHSGHWPMYSNPPGMWSALRDFLTAHDPSVTDRDRPPRTCKKRGTRP